jgi:hypothetical protein
MSRGITAYRDGRYDGAIPELASVLDSTSHPVKLTLTHFFLAMAHQRLGHAAEARRQLDAGRTRLERLGRGYNVTDDSPRGELMDFGWTEWVTATLVHREAEALVVYDPVFPADPFAP